MNRRERAAAAVATAMFAAVSLAATSASAAPGDRAGIYSTWTADASGRPASVALAPGFPSAAVTSDALSLTTASTATITGATPPGGRYGTSSGGQHLSFSPANSGGLWTPTTTTLVFESPTPTYGWSFILGDIDSESLTISANGTSGPLAPSALGFAGAFGGTATWDASTGTLAAATGDETSDSNAWFRPSTPIVSLSITTTQLQGSPTAHLWLAAQTASLSGSATDANGAPLAGAPITFSTGDGAPLPGTNAASPAVTTDSAGSYAASVFPVPLLVSATAPDGTTSAPAPATPEEIPVGYGYYVYPTPVDVPVDWAPPVPQEPNPSVVPSVATPAAEPGGTLPVMGSELTGGAASAGLLLLLGCGAMLASRLRRRPLAD